MPIRNLLYDINGTIIGYLWTYRIGNGSDIIILNGSHADKLRLKAPEVKRDQTYLITLTVTDDDGLSDKDSMKLLVKDTINSNSISKKTTTKTVTTTQKGDILRYYYIGKIGFPGTEKGQVLEPTDVVIDTLRNIVYVADKSNNMIDVFDTSGKYIKSWGSLGSGKGQFNNPADLAADFTRDLIFVSDIGNNRVQKFDTNGNFLGMWGSTGAGLGQFDHTGDISLDPAEKMVYVGDIGNHRIQKFDYDGNFVKSWGSLGTGKGQFNRPAGLTYDSSGIVFVADTKNNRIQKFDKEGNFVQSWGIQGKGLGQLQNPVSVAAEPDSDYLYVTHGGDKRIEVFDKHGKYVISWGSVGVGNGQLKRAVSVAFGNDNKIFVADKDKSEIDIFGVVYQTQPDEIKKTTTTKTTTTKTDNVNGKDDNNGKSGSGQDKPKNDPCNYYGLDICDKDRKGCDAKRFDCLSDNCNNGRPGTTGLCDNDDRPYKKSGSNNGPVSEKKSTTSEYFTIVDIVSK